MSIKPAITVAILTVSDRCSQGKVVDQSGPRLCEVISEQGWTVEEMEIVPDEKAEIQETLLGWCDKRSLALVLTTGGTGLSPRDVTPQATREILDKEVPGLAEFMRQKGRELNPFSPLSQAIVGIRSQTLIVNLPGSPSGAEESLRIILGLIPHALEMMAGQGHSEKPGYAKPAAGGRRLEDHHAHGR